MLPTCARRCNGRRMFPESIRLRISLVDSKPLKNRTFIELQ